MENLTDKMRKDVLEIGIKAIEKMHPELLLTKHLHDLNVTGNLYILAIGKAAWTMANAVYKKYGNQINGGIVITKYHHSEGKIGNLEIREAGHPYPDENSLKATSEVLGFAKDLDESDTLILLISGGASALFELPFTGIDLRDIISMSKKLMNSGASIHELNTVRKHLSAVKGGRLAEIIQPARIISFVLSDVIGDDLDVIASGSVHLDNSTSDDALEILQKYKIEISDSINEAIQTETPKQLPKIETSIIGNVSDLCEKAVEISQQKGYKPIIIDKAIEGDVKQTAAKLFENLKKFRNQGNVPCALIMGGEPVVSMTGRGKGGRNQHLALLMAKKLSGIDNVAFLALASDGTDGPTDAAGGLIDGTSWQRIKEVGIAPDIALKNYDSYNALKAVGDLVITGPTGTNVNDLMLILSQ
jgi:glycerate 2-kinase